MDNSIERHFVDLPDPRRGQGQRHVFSDMLVFAVTAALCAADSWADVGDFGRTGPRKRMEELDCHVTYLTAC